ncbi:hypothetical protein CLF_112448 [Clonorchis sinensis]|uniref:Uncharacterized protein n=1 Tax=Clonorchis sinensis TaxID=79923 RepID=G7YWE0_CLOSI|nr:hypothetical protein CLF_112448 [Clonorchis sinensis]
MDYETRLVVLDLFPLEYRRLRGDLILTYALFEQGLANRFFTVDPANTRRGHGLSNPPRLYGSKASYVNTDIVMSILLVLVVMMVMMVSGHNYMVLAYLGQIRHKTDDEVIPIRTAGFKITLAISTVWLRVRQIGVTIAGLQRTKTWYAYLNYL